MRSEARPESRSEPRREQRYESEPDWRAEVELPRDPPRRESRREEARREEAGRKEITRMLGRTVLAGLLIVSVTFAAHAADAPDPRRPGAIETSGVPPVPAELLDRLAQYQNMRSAAFAGPTANDPPKTAKRMPRTGKAVRTKPRICLNSAAPRLRDGREYRGGHFANKAAAAR